MILSITSCHYAECHYADGHFAVCHYAECHYPECHYADCHYADCHYAECHNAESHYAECHYVECHCAECSFFVKTNVQRQVHLEHVLICISIGKVCWQNFWQYHAMITPALLALAFLGSTTSIGEFRFQFHFSFNK
jgi:hypothetical protein